MLSALPESPNCTAHELPSAKYIYSLQASGTCNLSLNLPHATTVNFRLYNDGFNDIIITKGDSERVCKW